MYAVKLCSASKPARWSAKDCTDSSVLSGVGQESSGHCVALSNLLEEAKPSSCSNNPSKALRSASLSFFRIPVIRCSSLRVASSVGTRRATLDRAE